MTKSNTFPKSFNYTNSLGCPKKLVVNAPNEAGKYFVTLWEMLHGEFCGSGEMTREELNSYLEHFGISGGV
jgi:hypothetical protein